MTDAAAEVVTVTETEILVEAAPEDIVVEEVTEVDVIETPAEQGPAGPPGADGAQGADGAPGAAGAAGVAGAPGADGNTVLYGAGAPSNALGVDGNFYIDTTAHAIYGPKAAGAWPAGASIVGPQGAAGAAGPAGPVAGTDKQIVVNDGGAAAGFAGLTWDKATNTLSVGGHQLRSLDAGLYIGGTSTLDAHIRTHAARLSIPSAADIRWLTNIASVSTTDLVLARGGPNILEQRNGANAQAFRAYNTYTDASNYERGFMRWNANIFEIGAEAAGTGALTRTVRVSAYDNIQFWNTQFGYEMARFQGGTLYINNGMLGQAPDSSKLGGNGANGGNGWKTFAMAKGTTATVGNVTMNKSAGRINIASGATSITVTNDRCAAVSMVLAVVSSNDATAKIKNVVPADGGFTINMDAASTAPATIDFFLIQNGG